ncbi:MAG TPA: stilbene synthase, partial [Burkholderiales bacterium]|nr:stilbene synthase [Burkholderiales bacterium]
MFITGVGTAVPPRRYTQAQCWDSVAGAPLIEALSPRSRALLRKVLLGANGIAARHLALDSIEQVFDPDPDALHRRFVRHAPALACAAAERALRESGCAPAAIDAVVISTCTGYLCPGLTSYVIEQVGLRRDALALDLVGQGCGAALPNLRAAAALVAGRGCERVLSICVEVCSAAFYLDDDPGVLVSACLFGDGAAAMVLDAVPHPRARRVEWKCAGSLVEPEQRDALRFEQRRGLLRNVLTPAVPALAADGAERVLDSVLRGAGITRERIAAWIWHAGGRDVLAA